MPDVELVLREYAKMMGAAQHFESTLQALAALEIGMPAGELSSEEVQQRMVRFFSRGIGWIAQRLDLIPDRTLRGLHIRWSRISPLTPTSSTLSLILDDATTPANG